MPPLNYSTGPKYPTATDTANGSGISGQWANPANIFADDGSNATASFLAPPATTFDLNGKTFGFDIPNNAIIDGIVAQIEVPSSARWSASGSTVRLQKAGVNVGDNKATSGSTLNNVHTYGSETDLWGTTWTPAEINASNFGLVFAAAYTSSGNDFNIAIDYFRITVYWHYDFDVPPADVPKRHVYKVYDNAGTYLGNIPKVISPFQFSEDMESAGASLNIEVGLNPDITRDRSKRLTTEAGEWITDESGRYLMADGSTLPFTVGTDDDNNSLLKNGNRIVVVEYCSYYPNGKAMFRGQIHRIEPDFGGNNTIKLIVLSDGIELDNYPVRGVPPVLTLQQTQITENSGFIVSQDGDKGAGWNRVGQVISVVGGNIAAIKLGLQGTARVTVSLFDAPNGAVQTSTSRNISTIGSEEHFDFPQLIEGLSSAFIAVSVDPGQSIRVGINTAGGYANGEMYSSNYSGGSGGGVYGAVAGQDMYFRAYSGVLSTEAAFTDDDPTIDMLLPIMDDYNSQGGRITANADDVDATGLSLPYTFSVQTILEAIKAIKDMSPENFYWRIDLGTDEMEFKEVASDPEFTLIKGIHIADLKPALSIENIKNILLFSGGDIGGGTNLYTIYTDTESVARYGPRLERKSDNRVTSATTADAIGNSFIAERANENYQTSVTIPASVMDISLLTPGKVVGFANFGNFIDTLQLLIVRRDYSPNAVTLTLGTQRINLPRVVEQLLRDVVAQQTVANPSAPS